VDLRKTAWRGFGAELPETIAQPSDGLLLLFELERGPAESSLEVLDSMASLAITWYLAQFDETLDVLALRFDAALE
jgi:hypothetical protein